MYEYYRHVAEQVDIGIAMWSHPDSGYVMSPELCAPGRRPPQHRCDQVQRAAGDGTRGSPSSRATGSSSALQSEEEWLDNIVDLGWRLYLCSTPPFLPPDRR